MQISRIQSKIVFSLFMISLLCTQSFGKAPNGYLYANNTLDETNVEQIALQHPEISNWLLNHTLVDTEIRNYWVNYPSDKLWIVTLTTTSSEGTILVKITINDATGKVIGISYIDTINEIETETLIEQQAINFFLNQSITSFFILYNYTMEAHVERVNIVIIYGSNGTSNQNRRTFEAYLAYNSTNSGEHSFGMIKITSKTEFGEIGIDTQELVSHINNNSFVSNFTSRYPDHYQGISAVLYYDSNYHDKQPGYIYEVRLNSQNNFYLEYIDKDYQITYENGFNPRAVKNLILVPTDYLSFEVNHTTGEISSLDGTFLKKHEITDLIDLVMKKPENIPWIEKLFQFEAELTYNLNGIYSLSINSVLTSASGNFRINDTSGLILEQTIIQSRDPIKNSKEMLSLALANQDIINFIENNEFVNHTILFDTIDTWIVNFYNPILSQNNTRIQINDTSGDIIKVLINMLDPQPNLQNVDIINQVLTTDFWQHYFTFGDSRLAYYYNTNGYWSAYLYSPLFPENYYRILIDDLTGEIFSEKNSYVGAGNQTSENEARSKLNEVQEIEDFKITHPDAYETVYFHKGWVYYSEALTSQLLLDTIKIRLDYDLEVSSIENQKYVLGSEFINKETWIYDDEYYAFDNYLRINTNKVALIGFASFEILNRIFSFSVSELLGEEMKYTSPEFVKTEDENSLDLYIVIAIFGVLLTIFVSIRKMKK